MSGADRNRDYYEVLPPGRDDYWRYMAAPRLRAARILELLDGLAPTSVVDLGCGNGQLLAEIRQKRPDIRLAGIDLSAPRIEANRRNMPDVEWFAADLQQRFENREAAFATCDSVIASEIIEHVDDPALLLANAHVLGRPGASLIVTTQSGPMRETERQVGHVRHFTAEELSLLLRAARWTPLRVWNEGLPFHDLSKWWANRDPGRAMARFGSEAYGAVERAICFTLRIAFAFNSRRRGAQLFALARRDV